MSDLKKKSMHYAALIECPKVLHRLLKSKNISPPDFIRQVFYRGLEDIPTVQMLFTTRYTRRNPRVDLLHVEQELLLLIEEEEGKRAFRRSLKYMEHGVQSRTRPPTKHSWEEVRTDRAYTDWISLLEEKAKPIGAWRFIMMQVEKLPFLEWLQFASSGSPLHIAMSMQQRLRCIQFQYLGVVLMVTLYRDDVPRLLNVATNQSIVLSPTVLKDLRAWARREGDPRRLTEPLLVPVGLTALVSKLA